MSTIVAPRAASSSPTDHGKRRGLDGDRAADAERAQRLVHGGAEALLHQRAIVQLDPL